VAVFNGIGQMLAFGAWRACWQVEKAGRNGAI
jgi:hypothetical protein